MLTPTPKPKAPCGQARDILCRRSASNFDLLGAKCYVNDSEIEGLAVPESAWPLLQRAEEASSILHMVTPCLWLLLLLLLLVVLLLLVETKTAAQHSCHMLQVRDFTGTLLGIGSKVWRDVSSWTSCRCGTQVLVGLLLVFVVLFFWGGSKETTTGLQILFLDGVETTTSFGRGGSKKQPRGCSFCF